MINSIFSLDLLDPHPRTYQMRGSLYDGDRVSRLQEHMKQWGQTRSIVVCEKADGRYTIVAGHKIVEVARSLGMETIKGTLVPAAWSTEIVLAHLAEENPLLDDSEQDEVIRCELQQEQGKSASYAPAPPGLTTREFGTILPQDMENYWTLPAYAQSRDIVATLPLTGKNIRPEAGFGRTPADYLPEYTTTMLRQIVLVMKRERYEEVISLFARIRAQYAVSTNVAVFDILLRFFLEHHPDFVQEED